MKRLAIALLTALMLLLAAVPAGATENALAVQVGRRSGVTSIDLIYAVDPALASNCAVELAPQSGVYQEQNCTEDHIYISMAAAYGIDTSAPLAYITAELSGGAGLSRAIRLERLIINGKAVSADPVAIGFQAVLDGDALSVSGSLRDALGSSCTAVLAAYDTAGRMTACRLLPLDLASGDADVTETMTGCEDAGTVRLLLLDSADLIPLTDSLDLAVRAG